MMLNLTETKWKKPEALYCKQEVEKSMMNLIHVPSDLRFHGYDYIQVCRGGRSCVYLQTYDTKTVGFEVFIIRIQPETILNGKFYGARERWPKDEDFGKTAWTFWTLEQAMQKFSELEG